MVNAINARYAPVLGECSATPAPFIGRQEGPVPSSAADHSSEYIAIMYVDNNTKPIS